MSTTDLFWGKGRRCVRLMTYHPRSISTSRQSRTLTYPEPLGPPRPVVGDLYFLQYMKTFCGWRDANVFNCRRRGIPSKHWALQGRSASEPRHRKLTLGFDPPIIKASDPLGIHGLMFKRTWALLMIFLFIVIGLLKCWVFIICG